MIDISSESITPFVNDLRSDLENLLPDFYTVRIRYNGTNISFLVFDARNESIKVTWHNSDNSAHLMMHLTDNFGRFVPMEKVSWEKNGGTRLPDGVKFRKITAKNWKEARAKMVNWFKKNLETWETTPANRF